MSVMQTPFAPQSCCPGVQPWQTIDPLVPPLLEVELPPLLDVELPPLLEVEEPPLLDEEDELGQMPTY